MTATTFDVCAEPAGATPTCDGQPATAYDIVPPGDPRGARVEWLCADCAADVAAMGYAVTPATCDGTPWCAAHHGHHDVPRPADCDGPSCYVTGPAGLFRRGLITADEVATATTTWIHRAPCAVVRALVRP